MTFVIYNDALRLADSLHELRERIAQHTFGQGADLTMDDLAICHEQHGGDALDAIFRHPFLIFIGVDLGDQQFALIFLGEFIQDRSDHFAGSAPGCPEIYDDGDVGLQNLLFILSIGYVNGFVC